MIAPEWMAFAPKPQPLGKDDQWNVFLSYRSVNRAWVLNLYDVLRQFEHKVFLDQFVLKAGDQLTSNLEDALGKSQAGVLIWSSTASDSKWVTREYQVMENRATEDSKFRFVPIKLDTTKLPLFASTRLFLDFAAYPDGPNGGELLRLMHAIAGQDMSFEAAQFANEQDEASMVAAIRIDAAVKNNNPGRILQLFDENSLPWRTSSALGSKAAEGLTKLKRNDDAIKILEKLMKDFPRSIRPRQLYALALARRGQPNDLDQAQEMLGELYLQNERDPETLGIYGRTWMDRYDKSGNMSELKQSRDLYAEAFSHAPDDYYTGINAASKSVFLGTKEDLERAATYAEQVEKIVGSAPWPGDYWKTATVAEILLIQRKFKEAADMYSKAIDIAPTEKGSHESTWKQAKKLLDKLSADENERKTISDVFSSLLAEKN